VLLFGLGSMYADYAFKGGIDLIDEHFSVVLWASIVGMLLCAIGLIGWTKQLPSSGRAKVGMLTTVISLVICVAGASIGGTNVHGPLFFLCLLIFPVSLVGLVLWLSAVFSKS